MDRNQQLLLLRDDAEVLRRTFPGGLRAILQKANVPGLIVPDTQVVLALTNAIATRNKEVQSLAAELASARLAPVRLSGGTLSADLKTMAYVLRARDPFSIIQTRLVDGLLLSLNPLRGIRPPREAGKQHVVMSVPFDSAAVGFSNFAGEMFWTEVWNGRLIRFYYNKFPYPSGDEFAYHFCVVPQLGRAQLLDEFDVELMWALYDQAAEVFPNVLVGHNPVGGYCSINEDHFHVILTGAGAGVPDLLEPITCYSPADMWATASGLIASNRPFHPILYRRQHLLVPRKFQGQEKRVPGNTGKACWELALALVLTDPEVFAGIQSFADVREYYLSLVPDRVPARV